MPITDDLLSSTLQLEQFRQVLGINPYHFWQMRFTKHPYNGCSESYTHYRYLGERGPGRYDIIQAINTAESMLSGLLNYKLGYNYAQHEHVVLPVPKQLTYRVSPYTFQTRWEKVLEVGQRVWDLIESVTFWSVGDPDTMAESISFTVALAEDIPACELKVCYQGTQVPIEPVEISVSGLVATIVIKRWLLGKPSDWEDGAVIDANSLANLINTVDVYHVWLDPSRQITLAWQPEFNLCGCGGATCPVCSLAMQSACATPGIFKVGVIAWQPATYYPELGYTGVSLVMPRYPDMAWINYSHGVIDEKCTMPSYWRRVVTLLALTYLDNGACGCADVANVYSYWQEDLAKVSERQTFNLGPSEMDNPLGKRRGAINAWQAVKQAIGEQA